MNSKRQTYVQFHMLISPEDRERWDKMKMSLEVAHERRYSHPELLRYLMTAAEKVGVADA